MPDAVNENGIPKLGAPRAVAGAQMRELERKKSERFSYGAEHLDVIDWFDRAGTALWNHTQDEEANSWMLECEVAVRRIVSMTGYEMSTVLFFPNKSGEWVVESIMKSLRFVFDHLRGAWGISADADEQIRLFHETAKKLFAKYDHVRVV